MPLRSRVKHGNGIALSNNEAPEEIPRGLFLSAFALHRDRTEELYFITFSINIDRLFACRRVISRGGRKVRLYRTVNLNLLIIIVYYFTIALTAASPSTATTTIPAGAEMAASSEERTVLAIF